MCIHKNMWLGFGVGRDLMSILAAVSRWFFEGHDPSWRTNSDFSDWQLEKSWQVWARPNNSRSENTTRLDFPMQAVQRDGCLGGQHKYVYFSVWYFK